MLVSAHAGVLLVSAFANIRDIIRLQINAQLQLISHLDEKKVLQRAPVLPQNLRRTLQISEYSHDKVLAQTSPAAFVCRRELSQRYLIQQ